jgi:hypothetical protein
VGEILWQKFKFVAEIWISWQKYILNLCEKNNININMMDQQQPFWPPTAAILATNKQPFLATAISQPYIYQIPDFCGSTGSCGSMGPHCFFYVFLLESAMVQKAWSRSMVQKAWSRNGPEVWSRKHGPEVWSRIAKNLKKKKKKKIYDLVRTSTSTSTSTFCGSNWKLLFMKIYNF